MGSRVFDPEICAILGRVLDAYAHESGPSNAAMAEMLRQAVPRGDSKVDYRPKTENVRKLRVGDAITRPYALKFADAMIAAQWSGFCAGDPARIAFEELRSRVCAVNLAGAISPAESPADPETDHGGADTADTEPLDQTDGSTIDNPTVNNSDVAEIGGDQQTLDVSVTAGITRHALAPGWTRHRRVILPVTLSGALAVGILVAAVVSRSSTRREGIPPTMLAGGTPHGHPEPETDGVVDDGEGIELADPAGEELAEQPRPSLSLPQLQEVGFAYLAHAVPARRRVFADKRVPQAPGGRLTRGEQDGVFFIELWRRGIHRVRPRRGHR